LTAQSSTTSPVFLLIEPGAISNGSRRAQVASYQSSNSSYYNPAGLSFLKYNNISTSRLQWLPGKTNDIYYYILNKELTLGSHIIFLDLGEAIRINQEGITTGTYNPYHMAFSFSIHWHPSQGF